MVPTIQAKNRMVHYNLRLAQRNRPRIHRQRADGNPEAEEVANIYALCNLAIRALVEAMKLAKSAELEHTKVVGNAIKAALARNFKNPTDKARLSGSELFTVLLKMTQAFSDQLVGTRVYAIQNSMHSYAIPALDAAIAFTLGLLEPTHGGEKDAIRILYHGLLALRDSKRPQPTAGTRPLPSLETSESKTEGTRDVLVEAARSQLASILKQTPFTQRHADEAERVITGVAGMLSDEHVDVIAWKAQLNVARNSMKSISSTPLIEATTTP